MRPSRPIEGLEGFEEGLNRGNAPEYSHNKMPDIGSSKNIKTGEERILNGLKQEIENIKSKYKNLGEG